MAINTQEKVDIEKRRRIAFSNRLPECQCLGVTVTGEQCTSHVVRGYTLCPVHLGTTEHRLVDPYKVSLHDWCGLGMTAKLEWTERMFSNE